MMWWIVIGLALWIVPILFSILHEKREFNHGVCKCGNRLRHFSEDSQGGHGWVCDKCQNVVWVSWIREGRGDG